MTITLQRAKTLCTAGEFDLVHWSTRKRIEDLTPARLKQKIDRARKLRNKFRDLAHSQKRESRGKQQPRRTRAASGNERTKEKARLFQETLDRFEAALRDKSASHAATTAATARASKKSKGKKTMSPSKKTSTASAAKPSKKKKKKSASTAKKADSSSTSKKTASKAKVGKATAPAAGASATKGASAKSTPDASRGAKPGRTGQKSSKVPGMTGATVLGNATTDLDARQTRRQAISKQSIFKRKESKFDNTSRQKIQGHVSAQTRRNQARRDSKG